MFVRLAFGVGLLALGYFVGREMGRNESLRRELERERAPDESRPDDAAESFPNEQAGTAPAVPEETEGPHGA
jgi:hypothetical protein